MLRLSLSRTIIGGLVAASLAFATSSLATPPVFKEMSFEQASTAALKEKKILIFDAMTSWCGPCKVMDKTTWVDEGVVAWMNEHAVGLQLDMDKHPELRETLRINAYPTIIAFKDGKEFDRLIGLKPGPEFLKWLKGVAEGESKLDQALKSVKEERAKGDAGASYAARMSLADDLYEYGSYEEATTEGAWLWEHAPKGERPERLSSLMGDVARRYAPAKARFTAFRDEAAKPVQAGKPSQAELTEWLTLNAVVGDHQSTIDWALKMTDTPENLAALRSVGSTVFPLLVQGGQWETAGKALADPVSEINERGSRLGAYDMPVTSAPVAVAGKMEKGGTIPAIPLTRKGDAGAGDATGKTVPAIPLMRKGEVAAPAAEAEKAKSVPAIPLTRKGEPAAAKAEEGKTGEAKTIPAIPLTRKGEAAAGGEAKTVPAIPLMRKAGAGAVGGAGTADDVVIPAMGAPAGLDQNDPVSVSREVRYRLTLEFRDAAATYYAACLAAGREAEAAAIAELTFRYTDSAASRLLLAQRALKAGKPRAEHVKWLEEIEAAGQAASLLRTRIDGSAKK